MYNSVKTTRSTFNSQQPIHKHTHEKQKQKSKILLSKNQRIEIEIPHNLISIRSSQNKNNFIFLLVLKHTS